MSCMRTLLRLHSCAGDAVGDPAFTVRGPFGSTTSSTPKTEPMQQKLIPGPVHKADLVEKVGTAKSIQAVIDIRLCFTHVYLASAGIFQKCLQTSVVGAEHRRDVEQRKDEGPAAENQGRVPEG